MYFSLTVLPFSLPPIFISSSNQNDPDPNCCMSCGFSAWSQSLLLNLYWPMRFSILHSLRISLWNCFVLVLKFAFFLFTWILTLQLQALPSYEQRWGRSEFADHFNWAVDLAFYAHFDILRHFFLEINWPIIFKSVLGKVFIWKFLA